MEGKDESEVLVCPICWQRKLVYRVDRKKRPFFRCAGCGSLIFVYSDYAVAMIGLIRKMFDMGLLSEERIREGVKNLQMEAKV